MITIQEFCDKHNACTGGRKWGSQFATMYDAYEAFLRGEGNIDYMIWTYCRAVDQINAVKFACWCARLNWDRLTDKSRNAVEVAEAWMRGEVTATATATAAAAARAHAYAYAYAANTAAARSAYAAARAAADTDDAAEYAARAAVYADEAAKHDVYIDIHSHLVSLGNPFAKDSLDETIHPHYRRTDIS
jgi:hypothetical protein